MPRPVYKKIGQWDLDVDAEEDVEEDKGKDVEAAMQRLCLPYVKCVCGEGVGRLWRRRGKERERECVSKEGEERERERARASVVDCWNVPHGWRACCLC